MLRYGLPESEVACGVQGEDAAATTRPIKPSNKTDFLSLREEELLSFTPGKGIGERWYNSVVNGGVPVLGGLNRSATVHVPMVPHGTMATLDTTAGTLTIKPAVL